MIKKNYQISIILDFSCDIVDFLFSILNFNNVEAEVRGIQRLLLMIKQYCTKSDNRATEPGVGSQSSGGQAPRSRFWFKLRNIPIIMAQLSKKSSNLDDMFNIYTKRHRCFLNSRDTF